MINKISFLPVILILIITQHDYCQNSNYKLLRYVMGSGGILYSNNSQYFQLATSGESIIGYSQTQNHFLKSGFWNYTPFGPSSIDDKTLVTIPDKFNLFQNYPNPFNPTTIIKYALPEPAIVKVEIFNVLGQKVVTLINSENKDAGYHETYWDGRNIYGKLVSSGLYIYRIEVKSLYSNNSIIIHDSKKMIFLK